MGRNEMKGFTLHESFELLDAVREYGGFVSRATAWAFRDTLGRNYGALYREPPTYTVTGEDPLLEWARICRTPDREPPHHRADEPDLDWIIGVCPDCGAPVVSNTWHKGGCGYIVTQDCWNALGSHRTPTCSYRRVMR